MTLLVGSTVVCVEWDVKPCYTIDIPRPVEMAGQVLFLVVCRVKIKGVLQGGSWRAIASLENFFVQPPKPPWNQDFNPN